MTGDIKFYVDDELLDFEKDPELLYNWVFTDLENPQITKNSFSKTISIPNSPQNAKVFGHFWDLERLQGYGGNTGVNYNPTYRVPFSIYINGNVFEKGYLKLNSIKKNKGKITYEITCYGGLGNMLYNLDSDWNTGDKKTLADLKFKKEGTELDLGFEISKETIQSAWTEIDLYSSKWSTLNFAPCYNGVNGKLDSNKAVVNLNDMALFKSAVTEDNVWYRSVDGYAYAELPDKLVETEVGDYRSWCQRPCIRVKDIILACCDKENNKGKFDEGYDVELDPEFFNSRNMYWEDAWMTLPLLTTLNITTNGETESAYTANYVSAYTEGVDGIELVYALDRPVDQFGSNAELNFDLVINVPDATAESRYDNLYPSAVYNDGGHMKFTNVYAIQAFATTDAQLSAVPVDGSSVLWCQYNRTGDNATLPYTYEQARSIVKQDIKNGMADGYAPRYETDASVLDEGHFVRLNNTIYRWNHQLSVTTPLPIGTTHFRIRVDRRKNVNKQKPGNMRAWLFAKATYSNESHQYLLKNSTLAANSIVSNRDFRLKTGKISNFYTGVEVKQSDILKTSFSPAQFLMSYCRDYGLILHKDLYDDKIYIDTRNTYFKRNEVKDISGLIDYSKEITISPTICDQAFYRMKDAYWEGICYNDYKNKYGDNVFFGSKVLNSGWDFDTSTKDIASSVFKGAVQTQANGKYYFKPLATWDEDKQIWTYFHPYIFDGTKYSLYQNGNPSEDTFEIEIPKKLIIEEFEPFEPNLPYYDLDDKVELTDKEGKGLDGSYVMLFHRGETSLVNMECYLTDDLSIMEKLNNNPCYLITASEYDKLGNKVAILLRSIPKFTRYWYSTTYFGSGSTTNRILNSLDWGSPRQLYLLNYIDYEKSNRYSQFYKKYYEDMYSVDTRAVTLYIRPTEIIDSEWLRRFYWFDNCLWRLNKVIDYSPIANNVVKCEFVKIQDLDNMTNEVPSKELTINVTLDKYIIAGSGGTIVASVSTSDMGPWSVESWDYDDEITISPLTGSTDGTFTINVPSYYGANNRNVCVVVAAGDITTRVCFTQTPETAVTQSISITASTPISSAATAINYSVSAVPSGNVYLLSGGSVVSTQSVSGHESKSFAISANDTASARTYTLSGVTADGLHSDVKNVVQNAGGSTPPTPPTPVVDYNVEWGMITIDKEHSDIYWSLNDGSIEVYTGATLLGSAEMNGDDSGLGLVGFNFTGNTLSAASITFDFSHMSWNTALNPDICIDIMVNNDESITLTYSMDGLTGGFGAVNLEQYASGDYIVLDFQIRVRANN